MSNVLYITYDGLMEPLGQSQVFQYLKLLAGNHKIILLSYEKEEDWGKISKRLEIFNLVKQAGIKWFPLRYHKNPTALATSYDIIIGLLVSFYIIFRYRIRIIHARSYTASVIALIDKIIFSTKYIFDMRGFWPDEKVDAGSWSRESVIYKVTKWFEKKFFLHSDVVVSLTEMGVKTIKSFNYFGEKFPTFEVIPTCTNLEIFKPVQNEKRTRNIETSLTIGYVGTTTNWYLFDPVLECYKILLDIFPSVRFIIINRDEHQFIQNKLDTFNIGKERVTLITAEFYEISAYMAEMDATIFFIKPVYSKNGSAPTKLGEFLGCGIPCLTNSGVGDLERIISNDRVGVIIHDFSVNGLKAGVFELLDLIKDPLLKDRCIESAKEHFSLQKGVAKYHKIYQELND